MGLNLSKISCEFIEFSLYKMTGNLDNLSAANFIRFIEACNKKKQLIEQKEKKDSESDMDLKSYKGSFKEQIPKENIMVEQNEKEISKNSGDGEKEIVKEEIENIDNDELLEFAKEIFDSLYKLMKEKNINIKQYFEKEIKSIGSEEVIETNAFLKGLKRMGLRELKDKEELGLIKVLSADDQEKYIKI